jgi:anti-sigma B factor antagonist
MQQAGAESDRRYRVVAVFGVLDMLTITHLERDIHTLASAGEIDLILDLSQVRLCDASAMGGMIRASRHCRALGGSLRLAAPTGIVATAFEIVALAEDLPIYQTVDAARTMTSSTTDASVRRATLCGR